MILLSTSHGSSDFLIFFRLQRTVRLLRPTTDIREVKRLWEQQVCIQTCSVQVWVLKAQYTFNQTVCVFWAVSSSPRTGDPSHFSPLLHHYPCSLNPQRNVVGDYGSTLKLGVRASFLLALNSWLTRPPKPRKGGPLKERWGFVLPLRRTMKGNLHNENQKDSCRTRI